MQQQEAKANAVITTEVRAKSSFMWGNRSPPPTQRNKKNNFGGFW